jgi:hypothetical protein
MSILDQQSQGGMARVCLVVDPLGFSSEAKNTGKLLIGFIFARNDWASPEFSSAAGLAAETAPLPSSCNLSHHCLAPLGSWNALHGVFYYMLFHFHGSSRYSGTLETFSVTTTTLQE